MIHKRQNAFSIVECMIVVSVIGLLASLAIPSFIQIRRTVRHTRFATDIRVAAHAFEQYNMEHASYPQNTPPGTMPAAIRKYLPQSIWTEPTCISGLWDWNYMECGVIAGVSVYLPTCSEDEMIAIDKILDDGNIGTGAFRQHGSRYIYVIEE